MKGPCFPGNGAALYSSGTRALFSSRVRTGGYALIHPDFVNPFLRDHPGRAWERTKQWLVWFAGRASHDVRRRLFALRWKRTDVLTRDTSSFQLFTHDNAQKAPEQYPIARRAK